MVLITQQEGIQPKQRKKWEKLLGAFGVAFNLVALFM